MINEAFDDDEGVDDGLISEGSTEETIVGDFSRTFLDREIWFHRITSGQYTALQRLQSQLIMKTRKLQKSGKDKSVILDEATRLGFEMDNACLELIESRIVNPEDIEFLTLAQLRGELDGRDLIKMLFQDTQDSDDSEDPQPVVKKKVPAKKAVANAKRTKR